MYVLCSINRPIEIYRIGRARTCRGGKREWSARLSGRPLRVHCPKPRMQLSAVCHSSEIHENQRSSLKEGTPCKARDAHNTTARWLNLINLILTTS